MKFSMFLLALCSTFAYAGPGDAETDTLRYLMSRHYHMGPNRPVSVNLLAFSTKRRLQSGGAVYEVNGSWTVQELDDDTQRPVGEPELYRDCRGAIWVSAPFQGQVLEMDCGL